MNGLFTHPRTDFLSANFSLLSPMCEPSSSKDIESPQATRNPSFATQCFSDGSIEFEIHPSVGVCERYAILTQMLRNKQFSANWTVKNNTNGVARLPSDTIGNLTVVCPELLKAWSSARILVEPPSEKATQVGFDFFFRSRSYDFKGVEQARFEVQRMVLTHCPTTRCSVGVNFGEVAQTSIESLPDSLEHALSLWANAKLNVYEQPIVTVTVYSQKNGSGLSESLFHGAAGVASSVEKRKDDALTQIQVSCSPDGKGPKPGNSNKEKSLMPEKPKSAKPIKYIAPEGCERQSEIQSIYGSRSVYRDASEKMLHSSSAVGRSPITPLVFQHMENLENSVRDSAPTSSSGSPSASLLSSRPLCQPQQNRQDRQMDCPSIGDLSNNLELQELRATVRRQNLELELLSRNNNAAKNNGGSHLRFAHGDQPSRVQRPELKQKVSLFSC